MNRSELVAEHFEDVPRQAHAARLGMWVFLASEILLFTALFALYSSYRAEHASAFRAAVHENTKVIGSINTAILLVSSTFAASAVHLLRAGRAKLSATCVALTIACGAAFTALKFYEWSEHLHEGKHPAGSGPAAQFWTLYFGMTGLHEIHVLVGMCVLGGMLIGMWRGAVRQESAYRLELGAIYWHLVDVIWIFLWPLYYLA